MNKLPKREVWQDRLGVIDGLQQSSLPVATKCNGDKMVANLAAVPGMQRRHILVTW